jgi:hypothetical protein
MAQHDMVTAVLRDWAGHVPRLRALALVLYETLVRYRAHVPETWPVDGYFLMERTLADHQVLPLAMLPAACRPEGAPPDERVLILDLLYLLSQAPDDVPPAEYTVVVQALFLLLWTHDGRVQALVGAPIDAAAHPALRTRPPAHGRIVAFLNGHEAPMYERVRRCTSDLEGARSDGQRQRVLANFVRWAWHYWWSGSTSA